MAKGQEKGNREKRKPKANEAKNKVPGYMSGGALDKSQPFGATTGKAARPPKK